MLGNHYLTKAQKLEERAKRVYLPIWRALLVATANKILFACFSYMYRSKRISKLNWAGNFFFTLLYNPINFGICGISKELTSSNGDVTLPAFQWATPRWRCLRYLHHNVNILETISCFDADSSKTMFSLALPKTHCGEKQLQRQE